MGVLSKLARRAAAGNQAALNKLLKHLEPTLQGTVARLLGLPLGDDDVEEVSQLVLITIAEQISRCRATEDRSVTAWMAAIARGKAADYRRRQLLQQEALQNIAAAVTSASGNIHRLALNAPDWIPEQIIELLEGLSPTSREAMLLHVCHGWTWAEVADLAGTTDGAAKRRAQRAQQRLQREIRRALKKMSLAERQTFLRHFRL